MHGIWNIRVFMRPRPPRKLRFVQRYSKEDKTSDRPINLHQEDFYLVQHPISQRLKGQIRHAQQQRYKMPLLGWGLILLFGSIWATSEGWISIKALIGIVALLSIWIWLHKRKSPTR